MIAAVPTMVDQPSNTVAKMTRAADRIVYYRKFFHVHYQLFIKFVLGTVSPPFHSVLSSFLSSQTTFLVSSAPSPMWLPVEHVSAAGDAL